MNNFRQRRESVEPKITLRELSQKAGVARITIQRIETGTIKNPGILTYRKINEALAKLLAAREAAVELSPWKPEVSKS